MNLWTYRILKYTLILSCVLLSAALVILISAGKLSVHTVDDYHLVREIYNTTAGMLLIAVIGSAIIEERATL